MHLIGIYSIDVIIFLFAIDDVLFLFYSLLSTVSDAQEENAMSQQTEVILDVVRDMREKIAGILSNLDEIETAARAEK